MERVREKTSTRQPENGQMVERRALLFVVTDGHALSRAESQFGKAECKKNKRPDCEM